MLGYYILLFGVVLIITGTSEFMMPGRFFAFWKAWVSHRLFFLHGAGLIAVGFPLTCYGSAPMGTFVLGFGLLLVFTGPFILLYANKIRKLFLVTTADMDEAASRHLIYFDAGVRLAVGALFVYSFVIR
ncbi:MAG: hypothetical protein EPN93_01140 [Spirochaetes bacterium]|nr:MAG: hypothetical protein EPN93_01140 [Spirochaetota bacterium]